MNDQTFNKKIEKYLENQRENMRHLYNRVLPTGEYLFNRFDKAKYLMAGEGSSVYDTSVVMGDVAIGKKVWIGPYTLLEGINGKLTIGDNVSIDSGVMIYTHDTTKNVVSGGINEIERGDVSIGSNTVIGTLSIVTCNVKIGNHCVIGANSFVNSDIPDNSIAYGVPAKIVGEVVIDEEGKCSFHYFDN